MEPLVSIITPCYNLAHFLPETIDSVLLQSYSNWELIIIDDFSTDNSFFVANQYAQKDHRISVIKLDQNLGAAGARNEGIAASEGRFITFLDGDDLWDEIFLERSVGFLLKNNFAFSFSSYRRVDESLNSLLKDFVVPEKVSYKDILKTNPISCLTALFDTNIVGKPLMPNAQYREDYALWLNILKKIDFAYGISEPLATYRIRKGSISRAKTKMAMYQWMVYRNQEGMGYLRSFYYIINYLFYGSIKYLR